MASQIQQQARKKLVHHLDTPFTATPWPEISLQDQDTILELLCDLLSPLGQHRRTRVKASKGKRAARRSKNVANIERIEPPPPPLIGANIDVGFNSITRNLQNKASGSNEEQGMPSDRQYSMIFVARGDQSSSFNCHFPEMVAAASKDVPAEAKLRLVGISKPCSDRLSGCLGVPRVSSIAIVKDAHGASGLLEFVRKVVVPVDSVWLDPTQSTEWLTTKINSIEAIVGQKRARID